MSKPLLATLILLILIIVGLVFYMINKDTGEKRVSTNEQIEFLKPIKPRPLRPSPVLTNVSIIRQTDLQDIEIEQIDTTSKLFMPDSATMIGTVTMGCPCANGPTCSEQVWVTVYTQDDVKSLMYSKINNTWTIGPVQKWWLKHDALYDDLKYGSLSFNEKSKWRMNNKKSINIISDSMPICTTS